METLEIQFHGWFRLPGKKVFFQEDQLTYDGTTIKLVDLVGISRYLERMSMNVLSVTHTYTYCFLSNRKGRIAITMSDQGLPGLREHSAEKRSAAIDAYIFKHYFPHLLKYMINEILTGTGFQFADLVLFPDRVQATTKLVKGITSQMDVPYNDILINDAGTTFEVCRRSDRFKLAYISKFGVNSLLLPTLVKCFSQVPA